MKKVYLFLSSLFFFAATSWAQPSNDAPCNATELLVDGVSILFDNTGATVDTDEPSPEPGNCIVSWCDGAPAQNSSWFTFESPANGAVVITTCLAGNTIDTQMALYDVDDCLNFGSYTLVAANDDMPNECSDGAQFSSTITVDGLTSGTVYYIQLDGFDTAEGEVEIAVSSGTPQSTVNFIHNSADLALSVVDLWVDGVLVENDLDFRTSTGFTDITAGETVDFAITAFDAVDDSNPYYSTTLNLDPTLNYIAMFSGIYSDTGYDPSLAIDVTFYEQPEGGSEGIWNVLVAHGVTDAPVVDIELAEGGSTLIDNIGFMDFVISGDVPIGNYTIEVTDENGNGLGLAYCLPLYLLGNGGTAIIVASGFLDPAANSNGATFALFFLNPFSGNLDELPLGECPVPSNDNICNAEELIVDGPIESFNNTFATPQDNEPTPPNLPLNDPEVDCINQWCDGSPVSNTVWFYFVAPASGSVAVSTCLPTTFDTQTAVWSVEDCNDFGSLTLMGNNDDADGGCGAGDVYASAYIQGGLTPGQTYHIQLDGWGGSNGDFEIQLFDMVGVNEQESGKVSIYPNPVNCEMFVQMDGVQNALYTITDVTGKAIGTGNLSSTGKINCASLSSGVYFLKTNQADQYSVTRFVKE